MGVDIIAKKYNSVVQRSFVGEINVVEKMKKLSSKIGGEGNGGVILEESHLGRDSLVASALVLNHLAQSDRPFNKILNNIPRFEMIKDKIELINCRFIKPLDDSLLKQLCDNHHRILTIEEGSLVGGFGSAVSTFLHNNCLNNNLSMMGVPDSFIQHGTRTELLNSVGLNKKTLISLITEDELIYG